MRTLVLLAALVATPAAALDAELGADLDVGFAAGSAVDGPGGGATLRLGLGPNPLKLGPSALSLMGEVAGSYWLFRKATAPDVAMIRGLVGVRGVFTLVWLRKPADDGGRGRGIRLDLPIALHGGVGTLDEGASIAPTGQATVGVAIGLLPVQIGVHVGAGAISAGPSLDAVDGSAWGNLGIDVGAVF